jgi:hypothetical protein
MAVVTFRRVHALAIHTGRGGAMIARRLKKQLEKENDTINDTLPDTFDKSIVTLDDDIY